MQIENYLTVEYINVNSTQMNETTMKKRSRLLDYTNSTWARIQKQLAFQWSKSKKTSKKWQNIKNVLFRWKKFKEFEQVYFRWTKRQKLKMIFISISLVRGLQESTKWSLQFQEVTIMTSLFTLVPPNTKWQELKKNCTNQCNEEKLLLRWKFWNHQNRIFKHQFTRNHPLQTI